MTNDAEDLVKTGMRLLWQLDMFLAESGSGKFDDVSDADRAKLHASFTATSQALSTLTRATHEQPYSAPGP